MMDTYEIKVERNGTTYNFSIWSEEALAGDWCLALNPISDPIHPSWPDGTARYFPSLASAVEHIPEMIRSQENV
jgi:hypothetical protein